MASNRTIRLLLSVFLVAAAGQAAARERHVVRRELSAAAASAQAVSRLGAEQRLSFVLVLPLRNQAALTNLLAEIYDPASPRFRQFLTPEQFTAQFGPSEQDYQAALDYAQASGFEVTHQHPNRTMLSLKAPVAQIERAFGVTMRTYRHPSENRVFRAPDADLSLDVAFPILTVCGLDDFSLPRPLNHRRPPRSAIAQATPQAGPGSAPGGAYMGLDFRAAYAPGVTLTGAGQTVGLLQFDGYDPADIAAYKSLAGLPDVPVTNVLLDGFDGSSGDNNDEVCIDIEMAISMAPGLDKVIVYEAGPDGIANDILNQMVTDNAAKQLSASWTWTPRSSSTDAIFLQMAAQGQSFFQASGDWDAYTTIGTVLYPSDNPYVTSVGGTTLTMSGPGGAWESETAWNWGYDSASREYWGTGGGISAAYAIPSWQQGISMTSNRGSTTRRNVPDVALTADNVYVLFGSGSAGVYGGTSCATPLWAGFCALINQQAAINGAAPVGFINPTLYAIGKGANYTTAFHDTTTGNNYWSRSTTKYAAVAGYDLCTGWGTPNGQPLINALTMGFVTLTVQSAYGGAAPGSTNVLAGTALSEWIANSPVVSGATQYICTGATVLSNSFTQVSPTNITLTLTNNATLTWNWQTLYLLTTTTNGPGSVTAGGWRNAGSNAVLTATPGANAYFTGWLGDTNGCEFAGSVLTAPMTQARAIIAAFALNTRTLTVVSPQGGALPGTTVATTGTVIRAGVTNSPVMNGATQYLCTGATVLSNSFTQVSPTNITLTLTNNATLTWNWQTLYLLTTTTNGPGSVTAGGWRNTGSNAVLTATPGANAYFTGWLGDTNGCVFAGSVLTVPMTQARAIIATFALDTRTLTVVSPQGGALPGTTVATTGTVIRAGVTNSPVMNGATQYLCTGGAVVGNGFTLISPTNITLMLTNNATLTWNWQTLYLLTTTTNGPGSVTAGGWWNAGSNAVLTATPGANAYFTGWLGDTNGCVFAGSVLTAPMTQARAIIAAFAFDTRTLTVVSPHDGTVPGTTVANTGAPISEWITNSPLLNGATQYLCTGGAVVGNGFTLISPTNVTLTLTNNATLTWNWQTLYLLTTTTNGPGSVTAGGWWNAGSNAVLTATPGANAYFTGWLGDTNGCVFAGSVLTAPMTQARAITAAFALDTRTLTVVSANDGATPGTVTVNWGTPVSEWVTNSPAMDGTTQYVCVGVSIVGNGFTQISPTNVTLTLTNDASMTWLWTTNYWLGTGTNGPGSVSVASGWQRAGSNVTVVARPSATSHFVQWSGDTNGCLIAFTTLTVPVTRPRVITAVFAAGATPVISGKVTKTGTTTGVPGVTITFSGGAGTVITDGTGSYSNTVPYKWTGTATASFTNGGFATPTITYATALIASQTAKNYVWTPPPTISGKVTKTGTTTGVSGVTITFSGSAGTVITDGTGSYSNTVPYKWTGTATASFTNGGFVTPTITYATALITSQTAKNYVWMPPPTISGKVSKTRTTTGVTNVTITASNNGGATKTDAGGNYVLTVPYGWIGVVTPSLPAGGTFTPASKSYTAKVIASKTGQNFTWTAPVVAIVRQSMTGSAAAVPTTGFVQWAVAYGLVGKPSDLFNQVARSDGMTYGEMYALGTNLATGEPVLRLLAFHGVLTAEVPQQDPATLSDVRVTVEFANDTGSGFWFPAVCLPPLAPVPSTKQWFQAGWGEAADFRVNVQLIQ